MLLRSWIRRWWAHGSAACGGMRPFSPGATKPWTAVTHRLRHARGWRLRSQHRELRPLPLVELPCPVPGHRTRCSRPFVVGELGRRCKALISRVGREGALAGSVAGWNMELLTSRATHAHPTSTRSTGFCAIWGCISSRYETSAKTSKANQHRRRTFN